MEQAVLLSEEWAPREVEGCLAWRPTVEPVPYRYGVGSQRERPRDGEPGAGG